MIWGLSGIVDGSATSVAVMVLLAILGVWMGVLTND
jgi:hypothetical protein